MSAIVTKHFRVVGWLIGNGAEFRHLLGLNVPPCVTRTINLYLERLAADRCKDFVDWLKKSRSLSLHESLLDIVVGYVIVGENLSPQAVMYLYLIYVIVKRKLGRYDCVRSSA